jgi:hypothetical protein
VDYRLAFSLERRALVQRKERWRDGRRGEMEGEERWIGGKERERWVTY